MVIRERGCEIGIVSLVFAALAAQARADGSIASRLAAAAEGDTVVVPAGVWRERVVIDRRVQLRGVPGAVIDGEGTGTVLTIRAPGVEVRGLELRGSGTSYTTEDAAIRMENAPGAVVSGVTIDDALFGLFVVKSDGCAIENSTIRGKDLAPDRRGDAIRLWYSNGCRIARNRVERTRDVIIWYSADTVVEENLVRESRYGLHYMYSDNNVFRRNRFEDNQVGATVMYSRGLELVGNSFSFSNGPSAYGLLVKESNDVFVRGNRFIGNARGLFFDDAPQAKDAKAEVEGNLIARNDVGIALQPLQRRLAVWGNAFVGNRVQVEVTGTGIANGNEWSRGGRGNYWSDAVVYDADRDGVSELPYRPESTYEVLADRYPALAFYSGTPGAEAIDLGARLFPIFAPRPKLEDPHPLVAPALSDWAASRAEAAGWGGALLFAGAGCLMLAGLSAVAARRALA
jgi:nitrous oxidase accessory protein